MASQDETPTQKPTAGGEPLTGSTASVPSDDDAGTGIRDTEPGDTEPRDAGIRKLHGTDEHEDWDAEFTSLTATEQAPGGAASEEAPEAAVADPSSGEAGLDEVDPDEHRDGNRGVPAEQAEGAASVPGESPEPDVREAAERPAAAAGTVPGGHPKVAQRSQLPMRRASTLPDLTGYAAGKDGADDDGADDGAGDDGHGDDGTGDTRTAGSRPAAEPTDEPADEPAGERTDVPATAAVQIVEPASAGARQAAPSAAHKTVPETSGSSAASTSSLPAVVGGVPEEGVPEGTDGSDVPAGTDADAAQTPADADSADRSASAAEAQRRAQEREKAAAGKPVLARVLQVMIAVFFPVMVLAAAIRAVATPLFLWAEYHRPGFPADSYGFSTDDRMTYGSYAVDYLLNWSGSRYLGDLVGDGGEPLYLASEVSHMADVKTVLTVAFVTATVMGVLSILGAIYLSRRSPGGIRRALFSGALLTLVLMAVLVVLAVLGWEQFFTQVHALFFAQGNWTFRLDDTLIRLFPAQFWMDAGIVIAGLVLLTCLVLLVCCWPTKARRQRVLQAREDARRRYAESLEAL